MAIFEKPEILKMFEKIGQKRFYKGMSDLEMMATHFLKRTYVENLTVLPRMQDIPAHAFHRRCISPLFISHAWKDAFQPDHNILHRIKAFIPNREEIGLWIDYCCLPQKDLHGTDDRTPLEKQFFLSQLQYIPTIILKSQMVVLWNKSSIHRGWCLIELIIADIFKNVIMKQLYHNRDQIIDPVMLVTQAYDPEEYCITTGVTGKPLVKILYPYAVKHIAMEIYNFLLNAIGLSPLPLTNILARVTPRHIDSLFDAYRLKCANIHDIKVLKDLLMQVCRMAGQYDVNAIRWEGKLSYSKLIPYVMANMSDYTVNLIDYRL